MRRACALPELLAPAGDMECLFAAVAAGADAIYVGGRAFGARAYAKNFDMDELRAATEYCHLHGVKLYVTVNTLIYDREMRELSDFAADLYRIGADAVIVADLGAIREIKRRVPGLEIHASTQMSVHNTEGAAAAARLGCKRVVIARELSYDDAVSVTEGSPIETEIFLHGALCVCHSGQCLMSSLVGGRSGNRGECAQPCRLPYNSGYPLSLSDLSLAKWIPKLIRSGVASLKIEGRMKSPEYVYTVTKIYRTLLDEGRSANDSEIARLKAVFSRGDFTDGYFKKDKFSPMTGVRSEADKSISREVTVEGMGAIKVPVTASVKIKLGEPSEMVLRGGGREARVFGATPTRAINHPLDADEVKKRLSKMGATHLSLDVADIELLLDEGINLSPGEINALRRGAAYALASCARDCDDPGITPENRARDSASAYKTAQFYNAEEYLSLGKRHPDVIEGFDVVFLPCTDFGEGANGVFLPPVIFDSEREGVLESLRSAKEMGAKFALVGNIGHIELAKAVGLNLIGDFRLNITNGYTKAEYEALGVHRFVLSPELTLPMARDIGGGEIVYGRIPLMITERCFIRENFGCKSREGAYLEDRTGARFPIICEAGHRNLILNSRPTYMGDRKRELWDAKISHGHFLFTVESAEDIYKAVSAYDAGLPLAAEVRRIGKR